MNPTESWVVSFGADDFKFVLTDEATTRFHLEIFKNLRYQRSLHFSSREAATLYANVWPYPFPHLRKYARSCPFCGLFPAVAGEHIGCMNSECVQVLVRDEDPALRLRRWNRRDTDTLPEALFWAQSTNRAIQGLIQVKEGDDFRIN